MRIFGIALLGTIGLWMVMQLIPLQSSENRQVLEGEQFRIAHRCGRDIFPENTLYACKQVQLEGIADFLEFDFHLTKDLVPVVIHDSTLDRTTGGSGEILEKTWEELKDLDAGYHFTLDEGKTYPYRGKGIRLHTLEDFFRELNKTKLMVEVKPNSYDAADILLDLIEKYNLKDRIVIGSFHQNIKDYMAEKRPDLAYFASKKEVTIWVLLEKVGLEHLYKVSSHTMALPPKMSVLNLTPKLIQKLKSQNLRVHVWTINDKESIRYWKEAGVDGVMTDNPRLFRMN